MLTTVGFGARKRVISCFAHVSHETQNTPIDDMRQAQVSIFGEDMAGILVDLPCIIESQKTLDNINIYKTADISQVKYKSVLLHYFYTHI